MKLDEQNVVVELTESAGTESFGKGFGIGVLTAVGCGLAIKLVNRFVIKPIVKKRANKKEEDFGEMVDRISEEVKNSDIDDVDD